VRSLAADDAPDADDGGEAPRARQVQRGLWQLEGAGHPVHLEILLGDAGRVEGVQRAVEQALGDRLVEAAGDDGKSETRARARPPVG